MKKSSEPAERVKASLEYSLAAVARIAMPSNVQPTATKEVPLLAEGSSIVVRRPPVDVYMLTEGED